MATERERDILVGVILPELKEKALSAYNIRLSFSIKSCVYLKSLPIVDFLVKIVGRERISQDVNNIQDFMEYVKLLETRVLFTSQQASTRLKQYIADFLVILTGQCAPPNYGPAIHEYYDEDNSLNDIFWSVETILEKDVKIWRTITIFHNASSGYKRCGRKIREMIAWYKYFTSGKQQPICISESLHVNDLLLIQRTHEEICRLSKPLMDTMSYGSTCNTILRDKGTMPACIAHKNPISGQHYYKHSELLYGDSKNMKKGLLHISSDIGIILTLHNGRARPLGRDAISGLLQVIWTKTGRLFMEPSLKYLLNVPYLQNEVYDKPVQEYTDYDEMGKFHREILLNRLVDAREEDKLPIQEKCLLLLDPVNELDYERCTQQSLNYCEDFLLWAFTEIKNSSR